MCSASARVSPANVGAAPVLEVCVDRLGDALAAVAAGADRLEVCSALELGGLTPSIGLIKQISKETDAPLVALIRPRSGGFCYDKHDLATAGRDANEALAAGATGVVFGFLRSNGTVDVETTGRMVEQVGKAQSVFHRAFDFTPDQPAALEQLIHHGVQRVLTSGGVPTAEAGAARLRELTQQAAGRIEVMPGGGIRPNNVAAIVRTVGCRQVHMGASILGADASLDKNTAIELRAANPIPQGDFRALNIDAVRQTAKLLRQAHAH